MKKQKDLKVDSPQWVAAWKKILASDFIMRCMLETSLHEIRFWMEAFLMNDAQEIYQIRIERFLGETIKLPKVTVRLYNISLETLLHDLEHFWFDEGMSNYLIIPRLALAVPHRGFIRQYGSSGVVLLKTNHQVLMANYGAVREWLYQAKRGFVKSSNTLAREKVDGVVITYDQSERNLWQVFEGRFKTFLYRQQLSVINETLGETVEAIHG